MPQETEKLTLRIFKNGSGRVDSHALRAGRILKDSLKTYDSPEEARKRSSEFLAGGGQKCYGKVEDLTANEVVDASIFALRHRTIRT